MKLDARFAIEGGPIAIAGDVGQCGEDLGFAAIWTNEAKHDSFLPLVIAATKTQRVELGNCVAIAFSRSPMVTAQLAWDLQNLSGGRFILGLGTQVKGHIERRFGMPWGRPVARLHEYINALRAIWHSFQTGEPLGFEGEFYRHTLMTPAFNPGPIEDPNIPVYIAGVNTGTTKLAGQLCDGFHIHPFHSTEYVRQVVKPTIAKGAEEAGRDPKEIELAASVFVITGATEAEVREQREYVRSRIAFYASTPNYCTVLEAHGWGEAGEKLSEFARNKRWRDMPKLITDKMLEAFSVEAAPEEVGAALEERYGGLLDRVSLYTPFEPGKKERFWRTTIAAINGGG